MNDLNKTVQKGINIFLFLFNMQTNNKFNFPTYFWTSITEKNVPESW
jgi:hypothetical protein